MSKNNDKLILIKHDARTRDTQYLLNDTETMEGESFTRRQEDLQ